MRHEVELQLFEDTSNGQFGFAGIRTISNDISFNAFFNPIGIFHDVFEHWFEKVHKYFTGENAMNIGGEMVAMGAAMYYYHELGVSLRNQGNAYDFDATAIDQTLNDLKEAIGAGYCLFGSVLNCGVPRQKHTNHYHLETMIKEYIHRLSEIEEPFLKEKELEFSNNFRKTITGEKIKRLHRYGYKMAKRLVPNNDNNRVVLENFIKYWNSFCSNNNPAEMIDHIRGLKFIITTTKGILKWKAILLTRYPYEDIVLTEKNNFYYQEWLSEQE